MRLAWSGQGLQGEEHASSTVAVRHELESVTIRHGDHSPERSCARIFAIRARALESVRVMRVVPYVSPPTGPCT